MAEEKKWFTKTIARETVEEATSKLLNEDKIDEETKNYLDSLFKGKTVARNTVVYNEDGEAVFKRCSYFGIYLPIEDFGTVGKDDDGKPKYSYMSKLGAKKEREAKAALKKALEDADKQLEVDEDVAAWKQAKQDAVAASEIKAEYDGDSENYPTYEDALENI